VLVLYDICPLGISLQIHPNEKFIAILDKIVMT